MIFVSRMEFGGGALAETRRCKQSQKGYLTSPRHKASSCPAVLESSSLFTEKPKRRPSQKLSSLSASRRTPSQKLKPNSSAIFIQWSVVLFAGTLPTLRPFVEPATY